MHLRKRYKCNQCESSYSSARDLKTHIKGKHENDERLQCNFCCISFSSLDVAKKHMKFKHDKNFVKIKCDQCSESFAQKSRLKRHIDDVHKSLKNHKCKNCQKTYKRRESLAEHVKIIHESNGIKLLSCDICEFRCNQKSQLNNHISRKHFRSKEQIEVTQEKSQESINCIFCKTVYENQEKLRFHLHQEGCKLMKENFFNQSQ